MFFKRRRKGEHGGAAVAERAQPGRPEDAALEWEGTDEELSAEIERLTAENRAARDPERDRRVLRLRHLAGIRRLDAAPADPRHPEPDTAALPPAGGGLPEFTREELTPGLLRAALLRDGCALVRGLVPRDRALAFAEQIDRAFAERERVEDAGAAPSGWYEEFHPHTRYEDGRILGRTWIRDGGGVLAADAPMLSFEMHEMFAGADLPALVEGYLGEPPLISAHKTTLRKADPSVMGAWHQDGKFMGDVRALNLWLSLSRCGDESPGLDLVPRRLDHFVTAATDEAVLDYTVSQRMAEEAAGDQPIIRPIFEPGDALLFDELFLHKTGSDPAMPKPRYAIENWFFGGSGFPDDYAPIAV